jgi:hypothetical protein
MWALWLIAFSHRSAAFRPRTVTGPLGSRAWSFYTCPGSSTPRGHDALALAHAALLPSGWGDTVGPRIPDFGAQFPSLYIPLSNASSAASRLPSHGSGQDGSLRLSCMTLTFTTPRRFIPTLSAPGPACLLAALGLRWDRPGPRRHRNVVWGLAVVYKL